MCEALVARCCIVHAVDGMNIQYLTNHEHMQSYNNDSNAPSLTMTSASVATKSHIDKI